MRIKFDSTSISVEQLRVKLVEQPNIILEQDEDGQTLLHRAVLNRGIAFTLENFITLEALSVKDNEGRTPIHYATGRASLKDVFYQILPLYLGKAYKLGYDFSIEDGKGVTPLGRAIVNGYTFPATRKHANMIAYMLEHVPNLDVNEIGSGSKMTALTMSLNLYHFDEVQTLLDNHADPTLYVENDELKEKGCPLNLVDLQIENHKAKILKLEEEAKSGNCKNDLPPNSWTRTSNKFALTQIH